MSNEILEYRTTDGYLITIKKLDDKDAAYDDSDFEDSDYEDVPSLEEQTGWKIRESVETDWLQDAVDAYADGASKETLAKEKAKEVCAKLFDKQLASVWIEEATSHIIDLIERTICVRNREDYVFVSLDNKTWLYFGRLAYNEHGIWQKSEYDMIETTCLMDSARTYMPFIHKNPLVKSGVRVANDDVLKALSESKKFFLAICNEQNCDVELPLNEKSIVRSGVYLAKNATVAAKKKHRISEIVFGVDYE